MEIRSNVPERVSPEGGWLDAALSHVKFFATMRERKQIRRICVELLQLYRQVETEMPYASHAARYERVVEKRCSADADAVRKFMRCAEESFATWPVERPLIFRDIVQYMAVTNCLKTDVAVTGVRSRVVDFALDIVPQMIPGDL